MRLSKFSDYALRALLFAASHPDEFVTIEQTARAYGISQAHLKKVVLRLSSKGYLHATRGRGGGFMLGMPAETIRLGKLMRDTEPDFALVECFAASGACLVSPSCRLPPAFNHALAAFLEVLDRYSLHDFLLSHEAFGIGLPAPSEPGAPARRGVGATVDTGP